MDARDSQFGVAPALNTRHSVRLRPERRYLPSVRHLVAITGPIGSGKSTVAELLAQRLWATGVTVALADLDDAAFAQRGHLDLAEFWRRAGVAHSGLVRSWFEAGTDVVVGHGPFFESCSYESLFAAAPADSLVHHFLLRTPFNIALKRVIADSDRGPQAITRNPQFLRDTHDNFSRVATTLPHVDLEVDTSEMAAATVAERLFEHLASA